MGQGPQHRADFDNGRSDSLRGRRLRNPRSQWLIPWPVQRVKWLTLLCCTETQPALFGGTRKGPRLRHPNCLVSPCGDYDSNSRICKDFKPVSRVLHPLGFRLTAKDPGVSRTQSKEIDDFDTATTLSLPKPDAAPDRWVILFSVGCRWVQQQEDCKIAFSPMTTKSIAVEAIVGERGSSPHSANGATRFGR
jgi:hypothetical protein